MLRASIALWHEELLKKASWPWLKTTAKESDAPTALGCADLAEAGVDNAEETDPAEYGSKKKFNLTLLTEF